MTIDMDENVYASRSLASAWRVNFRNAAAYSQVRDRETGNLIAEVHESIDNALLISAAPNLYLALKQALDVMTSKKTSIEEQSDAITVARRALWLADRFATDKDQL